MEYEFKEEWIENVVQETKKEYTADLRERIFRFAVNTLRFLMSIPREKVVDVIINQLAKSATAIGANFEEAQATTAREFTQKLRIALREANETRYWLRIMKELKMGNNDKIEQLNQEAIEIALILGSIVSKMDKRLQKQNKK